MRDPVELIDALGKLQNMECWGVVAGEGTGSNAVLHIGQKIPRARPLRNPRLSEEVRQHTGEFSIFVKNCAWRLDSDRVIICTSKSSNANDGEMVRGLQSLIGRRVVSVLMTPPAYDLVIEFSGSVRLCLFCDCFDQERDGDNYSFHTLRRTLVIGACGTVVSEENGA